MKVSTFDIDDLIKRGKIESELELERSLSAHKKLRLLLTENPNLKKKWKALGNLIHKYESKNWSIISKITKRQIETSDVAEQLVEQEESFMNRRKKLIKSKLKRLSLNQQEFGEVLGHKSKSYMSELMNGVKPFTLKDLIVISKLLKIDLNNLVYRSISIKERKHIESTIKKLDKPKLKLDIENFVFA